MRPLVNPDARERVPLAEEHAIALVPLGVRDAEACEAAELTGQRDDHDHAADGEVRRARDRRREQNGCDERERCCCQYHTWCAESVEQRNQHQAAGGGTGQVRRIDGVDPRGEARDGEREDETAGKKRNRGERVDREHQREVVR